MMYANTVLFIDKPFGWTSFQVTKTLKEGLKLQKVGHAGTLDPLASGLLILCTNDKTKEIVTYQTMDKIYEGVMEIGKTTPSFDLETDFNTVFSYDHITPEMIYNTKKIFEGKISQVPPIYSAIKKNGQRAYKKARKNQKISLAPRMVEVKSFDITHMDLPYIHFTIHCGKGVYIRSIVHDFGQALCVGAHLTALHRTHIGPYYVGDASTVREILSSVNENAFSFTPPTTNA